jgi:ribosomal-protein-alanine N-acetyltransferase
MPLNSTSLQIKTKRLLLRPIRASDIQFVFEGLSHPDVIQFYAVSYKTLEETQVQMDWYQNIEKEKSGQWWAICDQHDEQFLGAAGINDIHLQHRRGEIGYWLLPAYWGQKFVPEALEAVCQYAFKEMNLHRIYAYVEPANANSSKVLQKLHFVCEGTMIECEFKGGKWIDLDIYALLNPDQNDDER